MKGNTKIKSISANICIDPIDNNKNSLYKIHGVKNSKTEYDIK